MLKRLSNKITKKLVDINVIEEADSELYEYGFWQGEIEVGKEKLIKAIGEML